MPSALVIVGPSSYILKDFNPTKSYDSTFISSREMTTRGKNILSRDVIQFVYNLEDIEHDFNYLFELLKDFDEIDIVFSAYIAKGMDREDTVKSNIDALAANCLQPVRFFSELSLFFPKTSINGIFISSIYAHVAPKPSNYEIDSKINPLYYGVCKAGVEQGLKWLSNMNKIHVFNSIVLGPMPNLDVIRDSPYLIKMLKNSMASHQIINHSELHELLNLMLNLKSKSMRGSTLTLDGGYLSC